MPDEAKCPFRPAQGGTTNRDWWPKALPLDFLHQHSSKSNPMESDFDYAQAFSKLDLAAVKRALNTASDATGRFDFNRDGRVNALDLATVRQNLNRSLAVPPATAALAAPLVQRAGAFFARSASDESEGRLLD